MKTSVLCLVQAVGFFPTVTSLSLTGYGKKEITSFVKETGLGVMEVGLTDSLDLFDFGVNENAPLGVNTARILYCPLARPSVEVGNRLFLPMGLLVYLGLGDLDLK